MALNADWVCIVKIRLPSCPLTHGEGACQSTSPEPCDNTFNTCFDPCNHACGEKFVYFSSCILPAHFEFCAFPLIQSDSIQRPKPNSIPGQSFSSRKYIRMTINDSSTDGWGVNPYFAQNGVIPIKAADQPGSLLGRLERIHKYFSGYEAEVMTGFCNQHISQFRREIMLIDKFEGTPHKCTGSFTLSLQDTLSLASDAKCPVDTKYLAASTLVGAEQLAFPTLGINLEGADGEPYLLQDSVLLANNFNLFDLTNKSKFGQTQYIYIDSELMRVEVCINQSNPIGYNVILKTRGECGTEIKKHDAGARVYLATHFQNIHITELVSRLFCECSDLNQALKLCCDGDDYSIIDSENFKEYKCQNPLQYVEFAVLTKPESLKPIINNLEVIFGFTVDTDPECGTVKMTQSAAPNVTGRLLFCTEIESVSISYNADYQRAIVRHSPEDCTKKSTEENAGETDIITTEDSLLQPCARRESRKINTFEIETRWITAGNRFVLMASMYRFLRKHKNRTRNAIIRVDNQSAVGMYEGDGISIEHESIQNRDGSYDVDTIWEVTNVLPGKEYTDICVNESAYGVDTQMCLKDDSIINAQPENCQIIDCAELF